MGGRCGAFDAVIRLYNAVRAAQIRVASSGCWRDDHLHLNPIGDRTLADALSAHLFR